MGVVVAAAVGVALLAIAVLVKTKNIVATARTGASVINKFAKTSNDNGEKKFLCFVIERICKFV